MRGSECTRCRGTSELRRGLRCHRKCAQWTIFLSSKALPSPCPARTRVSPVEASISELAEPCCHTLSPILRALVIFRRWCCPQLEAKVSLGDGRDIRWMARPSECDICCPAMCGRSKVSVSESQLVLHCLRLSCPCPRTARLMTCQSRAVCGVLLCGTSRGFASEPQRK